MIRRVCLVRRVCQVCRVCCCVSNETGHLIAERFVLQNCLLEVRVLEVLQKLLARDVRDIICFLAFVCRRHGVCLMRRVGSLCSCRSNCEAVLEKKKEQKSPLWFYGGIGMVSRGEGIEMIG